MARALISVGQYRRVLVVGTEVHSPVLDMTTRGRDIAVLFGDGAGAVILEATDDPQYALFQSELHSEGKYADKLWLPRPGTQAKDWINHDDIDAGAIFPKMEGRFVFKHAVVRLQEVVQESLRKAQVKIDDVDHFLFHQANLRINEHVAQTMQIPAQKVHNNIQKYGNCSAGSIPILLDECVRSKKIKRGDTICMAAFGSGFTWGSIVLRW
jgi:3-oxoacyl-[acyl-carrier-protein] synthase-3